MNGCRYVVRDRQTGAVVLATFDPRRMAPFARRTARYSVTVGG